MDPTLTVYAQGPELICSFGQHVLLLFCAFDVVVQTAFRLGYLALRDLD